MARGNFMQNSFLSGEWSPFAQGRSNEEAYYSALNVCMNAIPTDNGAWARRGGTRFSAHAKDATSGNINLISFVSETLDALVIELTAGFSRFHRAGSLLVDAGGPLVTSISTATPAVVTTVAAHGFSTGNTVVFSDISSVDGAPLHNNQYTITVLSPTTFSLAHTGPNGTGSVDGTGISLAGADAMTVSRVTERTVPYTGAQVSDVKWAVEENTIYLFHPSHEINFIDRLTLTVTEAAMLDGPYLDQNDTATTLGFSATSGSVTVTASSAVGINGGSGFLATDVGRTIRVNSGTEAEPDWTWLKITAFGSNTSVTATVMGANLAATTAVTTWRLGVFSDSTSHPVHGVIHEGRLWLIGPSGALYGSKTFDFFNFEPTAQDGTVADDNGVTAIFAGSGRQNPKWVRTIETGLLIGTDGGEYLARASSLDDPITPFTFQVRRFTDYGTADALPVGVGRNTLFIQSIGRALMEYRSEGNSLDGNDIARDARHLTSEGLTELAYTSTPTPIVWALRGDKRLVGCVYRDDLAGRQVAWHRHSISWTDDTTKGEDAAERYLQDGAPRSTGLVHSIASAPFSDPEGSRYDILWVAVTRENTVSVEYLTRYFDETFLPNEAFLVDSGNIYRQRDLGGTWVQTATNPPTYDFYGLNRLEGKSVTLTFRGEDIGDAVVSGGKATFVVAAELDTTEAAFEVTATTEVVDATVSFSGGLLEDFRDVAATMNTPVDFSPNEILIGEDGNRYGVVRDTSDAGPLITFLNLDGAGTVTLAAASAVSALAADGVDSIDSSLVPITFTDRRCVLIGGTPYFIVPFVTASGVVCVHHYAYYKINAASAAEYVGGCSFLQNGIIGFQLLYDNNGAPISAIGNLFSSEMGADGTLALTISKNDVRLDYPVVVAINAEGADRLLSLPSVAHIETQSPVNFQRSFTFHNHDLGASITDYDKVLITAPWQPKAMRGAFVPGRNGRTLFFQYIRKETLEEHAAATATNPSPLLTTLSAVSTSPRMFMIRIGAAVGAGPAVIKEFDNDATVMFGTDPFPDIGTDFSGAPGDVADDYACGAVFPTDVTDRMKPWYMVFYRHYVNDAERAGARIFLWDPKSETASFLTEVKGKMFDYTTDSVSTQYNNASRSAAFMYDATSGQLIFAGANETVSTTQQAIAAIIGDLSPAIDIVERVDEAHIDGIVGCNYYSRLQMLRPAETAGARNGPALAKTRRIDQYGLFMYRAGACEVGADGFTGLLSFVPSEIDGLGRRTLFTGVQHDSLSSDYNFDNMFSLQYTRPKPGTITAISCFLDIMDR